jgi:hypothetical protein
VSAASATSAEPAETHDAELAATPAPPQGGSVRSLNRQGDFWSVTFESNAVIVRDVKGMHHLARLLASPGVEFHALDLVGSTDAPPAAAAGAAAQSDLEARGRAEEDAGALLDPQAKAAYRERLEELREELEQAEAWSDPERAATAREEMDFIARELSAAVGLGGRDRKAASTAERARVNVTRALRAAIDRVAEHDPHLGHHLQATVKTGAYCSYRPEPGAPGWDVSEQG